MVIASFALHLDTWGYFDAFICKQGDAHKLRAHFMLPYRKRDIGGLHNCYTVPHRVPFTCMRVEGDSGRNVAINFGSARKCMLGK